MDIGDLIYIGFIVISVVVSIYRKLNKNKDEEAAPVDSSYNYESEPSTQSVDDILNDLLKDSQLTTPVYEPEIEVPVQPVYEKPVSSVIAEEVRPETMLNKEKETGNYRKEKPSNQPYSLSSSRVKSRKSSFNLKEAMIYDVIMNRPKYWSFDEYEL